MKSTTRVSQGSGFGGLAAPPMGAPKADVAGYWANTGPAAIDRHDRHPAPGSLTGSSIAQWVVDAWHIPIMALSHEGHLLWANQAGHAELIQARRVCRVGDQVVPSAPLLHEHWRQSLGRARRVATLLLKADLQVRLLPMWDEARASQTAAPIVLAMLSPARQTDDALLMSMAEHLHLTQAERAVLRALIAGRSPAAIASERRVALCTVRSQIRGLLAKSGLGTIRDLLLFAARLPALAGPHGTASKRTTIPCGRSRRR
ncbi:MAG: hypothetical protein R3E87_10490 [Burkholderiaceae bacterium]